MDELFLRKEKEMSISLQHNGRTYRYSITVEHIVTA